MVNTGKTYHFKVGEIEPLRLDKYLATVLPSLSRSRIQGLIKAGQVQINEDVVSKASYVVDTSCTLSVHVPPAEPTTLIAEDVPLDIIYEDKNTIVINKPAGMVVHPAHGHASGTLVHALLAHDPFLAGIGGVQRPGIVHRLDRDTSGVMLIAKNEKTHHWLQEQFRERSVVKKYIVLVDGHPPTSSGRIEIGIQRDHNNRKKMAVAYGTLVNLLLPNTQHYRNIKSTRCWKYTSLLVEHIKFVYILLICIARWLPIPYMDLNILHFQ